MTGGCKEGGGVTGGCEGRLWKGGCGSAGSGRRGVKGRRRRTLASSDGQVR